MLTIIHISFPSATEHRTPRQVEFCQSIRNPGWMDGILGDGRKQAVRVRIYRGYSVTTEFTNLSTICKKREKNKLKKSRTLVD